MQSRTLLKVFIIFVSVSIFLVQGCARTTKDELVGFWHEIPDMPSDWARTYAFFPDGTFQFYTNRMLCGRRLISVRGSWTHKDGVLTLTHTQQEQRIGGQFKKSYGSCADEKELIGAKTVLENIIPQKIEIMELKNIETDSRFKGTMSKMIHIDGQPYWKFSDDPNYKG